MANDFNRTIGLNINVKSTADVATINSLTTALQKLQSLSNSKFGAIADDFNKLGGLNFGGSSKSINALARALEKLKAINFSGFSTKLQAVSNALTPLNNLGANSQGFATLSSGITKLTNRLVKLKDLDIASISTAVNQLATALRPLTDEMLRGGTAAQSYATVLSKFNTVVPKTAKTASTSASLFGRLTKAFFGLSFIVSTIRRLGSVLGDALDQTKDWVENLNLFAVTFGEGTYEDVLGWTLDIAEGFGFANNELVKTVGLFKQLSSAVGIADEVGVELSKTLTRLALDFASFYNTTNERAFTVFESTIFAGQTKPARQAFGIDVSYQTLDNLLQTNEALRQIGLSSRQLTQEQKTMLRAIQFLEQGVNAYNDMAETINTVSNQMRVLQGSIANFKLALGDMLYSEPFQRMLVYVNALIKGITTVIRTIFPLKKELSYELSDNNFLSEYNEELDETQQKMGKLSFDKFEALTTGEGENENLKATQVITQELERQMKLYNDMISQAEEMSSEVAEMAKTISDTVLGALEDMQLITRDENGEIVVMTDNIKNLAGAFTILFGTLLSKNHVLGLIVSSLVVLTTQSEEFREALSTSLTALAKLAIPVMNALVNITKAVSPLITFVANLVSGIITLIDEMGILYPILYTVFGILLAKTAMKAVSGVIKAFDKWVLASMNVTAGMTETALATYQAEVAMKRLQFAGMAVGGALGYLVGSVLSALLPSEIRPIVGGLLLLAGAIGLVAIAIGGMQSAWSLGLAVAGIVAGITLMANTMKDAVPSIDSVKGYSIGGVPEKELAQGGSLFTLNEWDRPELMYENSHRQVEISNQASLEMSFEKALNRWSARQPQPKQTTTPIVIEMDGQKVGKGAVNGVIQGAKQVGLKFTNV